MREMIIAGNWKMNTDLNQAQALAGDLAGREVPQGTRVILAPPYPYLYAVGKEIEKTDLILAAQDMASQDNGAQTGLVSSTMLKDLGVSHVILGHSECRARGQSNEEISLKVKRALDEGLVPILCVGESLEEREAGKTMRVIEEDLRGSLDLVEKDQAGALLLAYEPVWAIGTGKVASPQEAQEVARGIRSYLAMAYGEKISSQAPILYGGSVKPGNAREILRQEDIDGALVGGASLKADDFWAIVQAGGSDD